MADIRNSDPQAMHDMAKELKRYAEGLKSRVEKLANRHRAVNGNWSGKQYDDFTQIIQSAKKSLEAQAAKLLAISAEVEKDSQALAKALNITIKV